MLGVPNQRAPVRGQHEQPASRAEHSTQLPEGFLQRGHVLEHLHGESCIEPSVRERELGDVRDATFDPRKLPAALRGSFDLVRAHIDRADAPAGTDEPRGLVRIEASAAPRLEDPLTSSKVQRLEYRAPARHQVVGLCHLALDPGDVCIEAQRAHLPPPACS
jgi:hypothetical protein